MKECPELANFPLICEPVRNIGGEDLYISQDSAGFVILKGFIRRTIVLSRKQVEELGNGDFGMGIAEIGKAFTYDPDESLIEAVSKELGVSDR